MVWRPVVRIIESMLIYPDASDLINLVQGTACIGVS
jgi:hypothetical protein